MSLAFFEADGTTPLDLSAATSLTTLDREDAATVVLKNVGDTAVTSITAMLLTVNTAAAGMTLTLNGRAVPAGPEGTVTPLELLDAPLLPGEGISGQRFWQSDLTTMGTANVRLVTEAV